MGIKIYITGIASISAQEEDIFLSGKVSEYQQNIIPAVSPNYKDLIPAMALRRMSKAVKMGITAAKNALTEAGISQPSAIITGTGQGCLQDTEKFLEIVLEQQEGLLAPTSFIQSTHNTVGGQIALNLKCYAYNVTYTQNSGSLESAFLDAQLKFMEEPGQDVILVGGVDEISEKFTNFLYLDEQLKQKETANLVLLGTNSSGTITSEGAHFFVLSAEKNSKAYAEFLDVEIFSAATSEEVSEKIILLLEKNELKAEDLDLVILGNNGDNRFDHFYRNLQAGIFFKTPQLAYKHLVGDYNTVSGYAIWLACKIFETGNVPQVLKQNSIPHKKLQNILIYNQYLGENHGIILLKGN